MCSGNPFREPFSGALWEFHPIDLATLPVGTFSARLEQNPFGDDCGVETREVSGSHGLLGVMGGVR